MTHRGERPETAARIAELHHAHYVAGLVAFEVDFVGFATVLMRLAF
jgi:hypothetical protein